MSKSNVVTLQTRQGNTIKFVHTDSPMSGAMKDVYFSPDKSYVVAFYKEKLDTQGEQRLEYLLGSYRKAVFEGPEGDYWKELFCWPTDLVEWKGKIGIVCPAYDSKYFFSQGPLKGKEKGGKWFTSASLMNTVVNTKDKGTWLHRIRMCLQLVRAVRKLHAVGLAHSDLSYGNVLVDPSTGSATIIDIDGLVVPGKFWPDVDGSPDFIAPEVMKTKRLKKGDKNKNLPCRYTDLHALAVLIYMYLLNRHPLKGGKFFSEDTEEEEELMLGTQALFIEHPTDTSNRPNVQDINSSALPQEDVTKMPYSICGPFIKKLFDKAFVQGLHNPKCRPTAMEWEGALVKTVDLMFKCENPKCEAKYFVFDNMRQPVCPFCGHKHSSHLPVLNLYEAIRDDGTFSPVDHRIVVYDGLPIFKWQTDRSIFPNEKLKDEHKPPVADCQIVNGKWWLINRRLPNLVSIRKDKTKVPVPIGTAVELEEGTKLLFDSSKSSRLAFVQIL